MLQPKPARLPEALATGFLAKKPLAHLLVYAFDRKLTGTFELVDETRERAHVVIDDGLLARVSTSEPVIYLGHALYEAGTIDGGQLSASLAEVASTKRLHGEVLLSSGMLSVEQLTEGLTQQRIRKVQHLFDLSPRTTFAFYPGVDLVGQRPNDLAATDPLPFIWRGVKAHPSWDHVRATIGTVGGRRLRLVGAIDRLGLDSRELAATELLAKTPSTVTDLTNRTKLEVRLVELLAYFLVITKVAEIVERVAVPAEAKPTPPGAALSSGEYVRKMSFAMRAVNGDSQVLRIPSPMPGRLTSVEAPARPGHMPEVRGTSADAEQLLSQAEMHFVLGERDQAVGLVRRALAECPGMPEAMAFLAYLEALGLGDGQDDFMRDLLRMLDAALQKDETCRRGRFYRAELRKRLGDHEGAIRDLRVAVMNDPDDTAPQRELRAYEQKLKDGSVALRTLSPAGGTARPSGLLDRFRKP